jgi:DNA-binding HxlR family transcriptional regulator
VNEANPGLHEALARVGDRWTLIVVAALLDGPRRFGELGAAVPGIATNILTARLRDLEKDGLIYSRPYSRRPLRMEYRLTASGADLAGALRLLAAWGSASSGVGHPRHQSCGTALEVHWWCPSCGQAAGEEDEVWV